MPAPPGGLTDGVFCLLREIERREAELDEAFRMLRAAEARLRQSGKMSALGEIAAGLAHELKQPLTVIMGLSESLLGSRGLGLGHDRGKIQLMAEASRKMDSLIRRLKAFSRSEDEAMGPVDLNSVIRDAFAIVRGILEGSSVEVRLDLKPAPLVIGSSTRLEQVVLNLAVNARDAMSAGGVLEVATGGCEADGASFARMSFRDTGVGIPGHLVEKIFDPFFTTKEAGKGTGLGLSISRDIIKEHNGVITVESAPGMGALFTVTLPAAKVP
jgi:signal transduction histidine kinase